MSAKAMIGSILVAMAANAAGCAVEPATDDPQVQTLDQEVITWCSGVAFREEFYAEAAMINLIGVRECRSCFGQLSYPANASQFGKLVYKFTCDLN
jgi:energy-converting hydrogenase Eha subunit E